MATVISLHKYDEAKVVEVMEEMRELGAPTIRVAGGHHELRALEGVHRLEAAHRLGLVPRLIEVELDALTSDLEVDWQDGDSQTTVADMLDYCAWDGGKVYHFDA